MAVIIIGDTEKASDNLTRVLFDIALRNIKEGNIKGDFVNENKSFKNK